MKNISKNLQMFNQVYKETNVIYHDYAAKNGISDTAFWIMYSVYYYRRIYVRNGSTVHRQLIPHLRLWKKMDL